MSRKLVKEMLCYYKYHTNDKKVGFYQADTEDFKKLFEKLKGEIIYSVVILVETKEICYYLKSQGWSKRYPITKPYETFFNNLHLWQQK